MYADCVQEGGCTEPSDTAYFSDSKYASHPVVYVSRDQANNYCAWADRRLPTEAEWEKAASWNDAEQEKYVYPWGNDFNGSLLNFCDTNCPFDWADKNSDDGYSDTSPVGIYPNGASPYGAYDMAGNVWEWVSSIYKPYPFDPADESGDSTSSDSAVLHGGSWYSYDGDVRSAFRFRGDPSGTGNDIGFRCAL